MEEELTPLAVKRKKAVLDLAKSIADKLNKKIETGEETSAFVIALGIAILKDILDAGLTLTLIEFYPFLGQIPGILVSAILMYFLWGKGWFLKWKARAILFVIGDNIPLIDFLPLSTIMVLWAWRNVRKQAEEARGNMVDLHLKTFEELTKIDADVENET